MARDVIEGIGAIAIFFLGSVYGQRLKAKAIAEATREADGLKGAIHRVENTLKEKL